MKSAGVLIRLIATRIQVMMLLHVNWSDVDNPEDLPNSDVENFWEQQTIRPADNG